MEYVPHLRRAVKDCSDRGLYFASKWASELLLSIPAEKRNSKSEGQTSAISMTDATAEATEVDQEEEEEQDILAAARTYAEAKEYMRASKLLHECKSARGRFMRWYFDFLAEEKRALRDWHNLDYALSQNTKSSLVPHQPSTPVNKYIQELLEMVADETDPWLLFLKALFLKRLSRKEEAVEAAILSIKGYPWNWSTWLLLANCLGDRDELGAIISLIDLPPNHPLIEFFKMKVIVDLHAPVDEDLRTINRLLKPDFFPESAWLMGLRAATLYHLHDFHRAEVQFDMIMKVDPMRIDDIDILSNILYVAENRVKLSKLAHHYLNIDKDRPEVCCMVGNHYSLRGEPERAIQYFRRATELDQSYLPAWTLMGHEYVEIKNSHAAIESYRRAIDVNRKDYRAWYGLGQAYELLNMHQYSLHYYQRATALRPYDVRIWQAQGMCYEEMGRPREAIECLKRALLGAEDNDVQLCSRLAKLYDEIEDYASAAEYHQRIIDTSERENRPIFTYAKSLVYVARYHFEKGGGDMGLAHDYLERVAESNAEEVMVANEMLKRMAIVVDRTAAGQANGNGKGNGSGVTVGEGKNGSGNNGGNNDGGGGMSEGSASGPGAKSGESAGPHASAPTGPSSS
ncbi:TPR-like protein [Fomitiporia mediterranea MF3/22]|uniref:TPR-like protein n=1 Tax=Fomitiporia mediterranea (strain MF3/22) TaxID=694068 RepID=UPI00044087A8|nr:TPR-like protein [Fomitiporia mediterranea MF3/22]EJD02696.1 TPR-like protein [Fomitiporia mediterranea MF3/22]